MLAEAALMMRITLGAGFALPAPLLSASYSTRTSPLIKDVKPAAIKGATLA